MRLAVFCGSSAGHDPQYTAAAEQLGKYLAQQHIELVYGGGKVGLMGTIADTVMEQGGRVYGVIPERLRDKELAHEGITELMVVADMHQRKAKMAALADGFIAMPGGAGTLEEIFEVWTWAQLGYHKKPVGFYNVNGFYNTLFTLLQEMVAAGFLKDQHCQPLIKSDQPAQLIEQMKAPLPWPEKWT